MLILTSKLERNGFEGLDYLEDKELVGWLQPKSCGEWLYIQVGAVMIGSLRGLLGTGAL